MFPAPSEQSGPDPQEMDSTERRVFEWRLECFTLMGHRDEWARVLAGSEADMQEARRLHEQGCPLDLMIRILT